MADAQAFGKYHLLGDLGRGSFAAVYRAQDPTLAREVALKLLHPQLLTDAGFVARFQREARALANLRHPHIITVYEVGSAEGRVYIAMELARGTTLGEAIAAHGSIPWAEALALLRPVCEALDYAHAQGVVHRDLKPSNILLDVERGPLLTDFGFARLMSDSSQSMSLSGGILGTPGYIAPEVWEMDAATRAADLYALGCIAFEMLTGRVLFAGSTPMQAVRAHDQGPQFPETWPEGVPEGVAGVLAVALARDPGQRYPSALAFWHALEGLEAQAQAAKEAAARAAVAVQWKADAEAALAAGELGTARMAGGRWLAASPEDAGALAFLEQVKAAAAARAEAQERAGLRGETDRRSQEETRTGSTGTGAGAPRRPRWLWPALAALAVIVLAGVLWAAWPDRVPDATPTPKTAAQVPAGPTRTPADTPAPPTATLLPPTDTPAPPTGTPAPTIGSTRLRDTDGMVMVYVPAGEFMMGSLEGEGDRDEHPQHEVYLDAFWIDRTEVTNDQYRAFVDATGQRAPTTCDWGEPTYDDAGKATHPVVCVSWDDAKDYCAWAGARLPTEAEWEKAARGTDGRVYPWGATFDGRLANYCDLNCESDYKDGAHDDGYARTAPVGSYPGGASPYGALDMAGNVWEWVSDWYDGGYYGSSPARNPQGPASGQLRGLRGGSWCSYSINVRSAVRNGGYPGIRSYLFGFRCVSSSTSSP